MYYRVYIIKNSFLIKNKKNTGIIIYTKIYLISKFLASMFQNISIGTATVLSECI